MNAADTEYITEITGREKTHLLNFIRQQVRVREDAEDILQDVLFQFLKGFTDIRDTERITSWLFTVTRNKIRDYFRKQRPERYHDWQIHGQDAEGLPLMLEDILPAIGSDPEDRMMRDWIWEAIEKALEEMPGPQREVFVRNEFEDKSFKEMAEETGEALNTLLSRKRYAILFLRGRLTDLYHQL